MRRGLILFAALIAGTTGATAQMTVTTIGATDAAACFQNAADDFAEDVRPCDAALDNANTTRNDRKKTLVNRGIILNRNGDINAAISDFDAAIAIDDGLAEAYLNRGNSWFYAGRLDDALADYETALSLDVAQPWAGWYNIGLVYDAKKETAKAQEAYAKALELNPDFGLAQRKISQ